MRKHIPTVLLALLMCALPCGAAYGAKKAKPAKAVNDETDSTVSLLSPGNKTEVRIAVKGGANGKSLAYDLRFNGRTVLTGSPLGVVLEGDDVLAENLKIEAVTTTSINETYETPFGKKAKVTNAFHGTILTLLDTKGRRFSLEFRAYDDGAAFRYSFPLQDKLRRLRIAGERSGFAFAGDYTCWGQQLNSYTTSYEKSYTKDSIHAIHPDSLLSMPVLVKAGNTVWAAVTEANIDNYAGMYLKHTGGGYTLSCSLSPLPESPGVAVSAETPHKTPWRVVMLGDNPGRLTESDIVLNLNEPCALKDISWIKPGRVAWDWWSGQVVKGRGFEGKMDDRTMKHYIDFAAETGLEYMLIDAGWYGEHTDRNADITKCIPGIDIPGLVKYAGSKGVDIILWLNWECVSRQMDEAFPLYRKWGVKGVKIDYMNRDDQWMVNFYRRTVKKAAEYNLLVDFHGAFKPDGWRRTYPNLMTREGVMGLEYSKWSDNITPGYDCILPFTRMLAGPMDYTPGGFSNATRSRFKAQMTEPMTQGTRCHQLALYVIFESPLQMLPDYPDNYRGKPGLEFLKRVPVVWDDTKVLHAEVGEYVTIARRHGNDWYLGSITDWTPRELSVPLGFLGAGTWKAEIFADGADSATNAQSVAIGAREVKSSDTLSWKLGPGGGYAVRFSRK